jgi:hypothetical protein
MADDTATNCQPSKAYEKYPVSLVKTSCTRRMNNLGTGLVQHVSIRFGHDQVAPTSSRCMDHVIVLNEQHLKRLMSEYVRYYHEDRTHVGLPKDTPTGRPAAICPAVGSKILSFPRLGGLHHRYAVAA